MSAPAYESYKDSGVEWLGQVPSHWNIVQLRHLLSRSFNGTTSTQVDEGPETVAVTRIETISKGHIDLSKVGYIPIGDALPSFKLEKGDILFSHINSLSMIGNCAIFNGGAQLYAGMNLLTLRPFNHVSSLWLNWVLKSPLTRSVVSASAKPAINQASIPQSSLLGIHFPYPTFAEQTAIAAFLDRETGKIDALIEAQTRLIELLKEKRQAVISHAVTKGLNPDAPMKDSGIEWLGQVPAHWDCAPVKRLCKRITDGAHISPETENGVHCFVSTRDVSETGIDFEGCLRTSEASYDYLRKTGCKPLVGDVLFSKDGTIGRTTVVREERDFVVASSLIIIRPEPNILDANYLDFLCQSRIVKEQVDRFVKGAGLPRLSVINLTRVIGTFPPLTEQKSIATYLSQISKNYLQLVEASNATMTLLQERRAALISAAVTGKIDVRGLATIESEAA